MDHKGKLEILGKAPNCLKAVKESNCDLHPKLWTIEDLTESYQLSTEEKIIKDDGVRTIRVAKDEERTLGKNKTVLNIL